MLFFGIFKKASEERSGERCEANEVSEQAAPVGVRCCCGGAVLAQEGAKK